MLQFPFWTASVFPVNLGTQDIGDVVPGPFGHGLNSNFDGRYFFA